MLRLSFIASLVLASVTMSVGPQAQQLPVPVIAVMDFERILRDSAAHKNVLPQMEKLQNKVQDEIRDQEKALRDAESDMQRQRTVLAPEVYQQKRREFEQRIASAQQDVNVKKQSLDRAFGNVMNKVRAELLQIAAEIARERSITLMLPKTSVILTVPEMDVTAEALTRLDKKLPTVQVSLTDKPPAQAAPAAPQQQRPAARSQTPPQGQGQGQQRQPQPQR